jgi:hypothetical protein
LAGLHVTSSISPAGPGGPVAPVRPLCPVAPVAPVAPWGSVPPVPCSVIESGLPGSLLVTVSVAERPFAVLVAVGPKRTSIAHVSPDQSVAPEHVSVVIRKSSASPAVICALPICNSPWPVSVTAGVGDSQHLRRAVGVKRLAGVRHTRGARCGRPRRPSIDRDPGRAARTGDEALVGVGAVEVRQPNRVAVVVGPVDRGARLGSPARARQHRNDNTQRKSCPVASLPPSARPPIACDPTSI